MPQIDYPVNSAEALPPGSLPPLRQAVSRTDRVREALRQAILEGALQSGKALVERELAEVYGVSKTPVREALKQVHSTGLVEINAYQGVGVRRPDNSLVQELYGARCAAEPEAVRLGAVRLGATAHATARQALQDATALQLPLRLPGPAPGPHDLRPASAGGSAPPRRKRPPNRRRSWRRWNRATVRSWKG
ncbi:GntR family transcriptional regulator [Streptomyces sp. NPDC046332]|uniref:GntR family transcriptional regulator n=1 Tax=Streptomyces sp. NPDC046332 TaxID=3155133 RepID=UPI0033CE2468